jgi:hypothetical protein
VRYLIRLEKAVRIVVIAATILAVFSATNLVYHLVRKPTEVFAPVSGEFNKTPVETWRQYAPLFREYSTASISPELLAALAQVEGAGNPVASTYWRWRLSWNPFAIYQPASSSVGMYQMTDAAFAEAQPYCIRDHIVVENGCSLIGLDSRVPPSRAIELTAVFLDRKVTAILTRPLKAAASTQQKRQLAAIIHLCGASSAKAFARRGFHPTAGERCGDQEVATYLAQINAMMREFLRMLHLNAGNSGVQLLRSTYSGTLQYTHSKFANRTAAVTRNTQRTPKAAATAPPESGPIELPRNIAEAVMP